METYFPPPPLPHPPTLLLLPPLLPSSVFKLPLPPLLSLPLLPLLAPPTSLVTTGTVSVSPSFFYTYINYSKLLIIIKFDEEIVLVFEASKVPGQAQFTNLNAVASNSNAFPINNFSIQAAVPKYLQIRMVLSSLFSFSLSFF